MLREPRLVKTFDEERGKRLAEDVVDRALRRLDVSKSRTQFEPKWVARAEGVLAARALLVTISRMMVTCAVRTLDGRFRRFLDSTELLADTSEVGRNLGNKLVHGPPRC